MGVMDRERSRALPSWRYQDPAIVAERMDVKPERPPEPVKRKRCYGLLSVATLRMVKKMRIRELMAKVRP